LTRQLKMLKEMGCNSLRTSHNPPAPELLELADKMGFLVWDEAFDAWKKGKRVGIPKIQNHTMKFYYISHMQDVEEGKYNILEPTTKELANNPEALIVMPGVAFDKERNRIGYGGGYYDRYLKLHPCGQTIALSYEIQCVSHISAEAFDFRPEILVTEGRILPMINEDNVTVISE
ncbi:MAG: 5-formyltetrahydrofolate cyclo-ligase, partial [Lachnospiraceae bacterium]